MSVFCCLRTCLVRKSSTVPNRKIRKPEIHLDGNAMGPDVILLSNQMRITGTGGALATAPLVQSKSYFEVKIQQAGSWSVGLATRQAELSKKCGGIDKETWCLCSDNTTRHNNEQFGPVVVKTEEPKSTAAAGLIGIEDINEDMLLAIDSSSTEANINEDALISAPPHIFPDEGDIVGVAYDHVELNFYFNGKNLEVPFRNVRGSLLYPVVFVGSGAILDIILDNFHYGPPPGFDKIMLEQSLL